MQRRARRYGDGGLVGRRAMVVTTVGANAATTGPRGIHGEITDVLFPVLHGTLWYTGMSVVAPLVINDAVGRSSGRFDEAVATLRERLLALPDTEPMPYRSQNGGDYDDRLLLRPEHALGAEGIRIHYRTYESVTHQRSGSPTEASR